MKFWIFVIFNETFIEQSIWLLLPILSTFNRASYQGKIYQGGEESEYHLAKKRGKLPAYFGKWKFDL